MKYFKKYGFSLLFATTSLVAMAQGHQQQFNKLVTQYRQINWNGLLYAGNKNSVTYKKAFGYSNIEAKKPNQLTTRFKTESVGKMFTAIRIMQLVAAGKLKLSSTVAILLPDWNIPKADKITVEHLLTHASGLSSPWDHPRYEFGKIFTNAELKKIIEEAPVIFDTPGAKNYYSNSGYILLAMIIERIDGESFESSIHKNIFVPAGMFHTCSLNDSVLPANAARPYYQVTAKRFAPDNTKYGDGKASGAGGWMSTAEDLFHFAQAWLNEKLLPRKWMEIQYTNDHKLDSSSGYTRLGFHILRERPSQTFIIGHNGGGKGFSADVYFDIYNGDIVVFCSNQYGAGYQLTSRAFSILHDQSYRIPQLAGPAKVAEWLLKQPAGSAETLSDAVLQSMGLKEINDFLFFSVFDNLTEIGEHRVAGLAIKASRERFPGSIYSWIKSGENAQALNQPQQVRQFFNQAMELAKADTDKTLAEVIQQKLEQLKN